MSFEFSVSNLLWSLLESFYRGIFFSSNSGDLLLLFWVLNPDPRPGLLFDSCALGESWFLPTWSWDSDLFKLIGWGSLLICCMRYSPDGLSSSSLSDVWHPVIETIEACFTFHGLEYTFFLRLLESSPRSWELTELWVILLVSIKLNYNSL